MLHKLTKSFVDKVSFEKSGQVFYRDSELLGFGLRVGKSAKVYYAEVSISVQYFPLISVQFFPLSRSAEHDFYGA
jgi:hypothetical protein